MAAASAALTTINTLIQKVNDTGSGVQQVMSMVSEFGEAIDQFELERKTSTFKALSQADLLKLSQIRRSYQRQWKQIEDLLAMFDPELLADFRKAKAEQEERRKAHAELMAKKRRLREQRIQQVLVGTTAFIVLGTIAFGVVALVIKSA